MIREFLAKKYTETEIDSTMKQFMNGNYTANSGEILTIVIAVSFGMG